MGIILSRAQQVDTDAFIWCQKKFSKKSYYPIIRTISATGDGWIYATIAFIALAINFEQYSTFFLACLIGFGLEVPLYIGLKHKFKRNRPQDFLNGFEAKIIPSDKFSFPSGHTAAAFVMAIQILVFIPQLAAIAIAWALLIGFSRVALGVHFPGDILAGACLGVLCALISNAILM